MTVDLTRRRLLGFAPLVLAAPAILKLLQIMPVKVIPPVEIPLVLQPIGFQLFDTDLKLIRHQKLFKFGAVFRYNTKGIVTDSNIEPTFYGGGYKETMEMRLYHDTPIPALGDKMTLEGHEYFVEEIHIKPRLRTIETMNGPPEIYVYG